MNFDTNFPNSNRDALLKPGLILRRTLKSEITSGNWKPLKNDENSFLFYFKSSSHSQDI